MSQAPNQAAQQAAQQAAEQKKRQNQKGRGGEMIILEPVAGTRDFLPADMRIRNWLFSKFNKVAEKFSFEPYDAPMLEPVDLYKRKAGEEIVEQMYNFEDKSGYEVTLRPEMTPSLARLILKQGRTLILPVKYYSIPQCWRYENTTRGRKREHYQWNMDIWGIPEVTAEAELLAAIVSFFESVGLTSKDVGIKISSRKVLQLILESFGIVDPQQFAATCVIVDKLDKIGGAGVTQELVEKIGLSKEVSDKILKVLAVKSIAELDTLLQKETGTEDKKGTNPAVQELIDLFEYAKGYGYDDWLIFDASIVRGLSYYTGIVFEGFTRYGELQRAICGGGRYDKILQTYGSKTQIPACGFGFGDCVILEILKDMKLLPEGLDSHFVDDVIIPFDESLRNVAFQIATKLRKEIPGRRVDIILKKKCKIGKAYSHADRVGADNAILIAPDEFKRGCVRVKFLRESVGLGEKPKDEKEDENSAPSGNEQEVKLEDLVKFLLEKKSQ